MSDGKRQITKKQAGRIFVLETFSAAALFLPRAVLKENYGSGVLSVIMALFLVWVYGRTVRLISEGTTMEQIFRNYRWAAVLYYLRFWFNASFFYAHILYMTKRYLLPQENTFLVGAPLIFLAYHMNQGNMERRAEMMEGIFWFILLPVMFVLLLGAFDLSVPQVAADSFRWGDFGRGSLIAFGLLHPIELVWFYMENIKERETGLRPFLFLAALLLGIYTVTVGSLGRNLVIFDENPVMSMAQGIAMPGGIMARLDIFLIAFWMIGGWSIFTGYLFYGNESLTYAFPKIKKTGKILSYAGIFLASGFFLDFWKRTGTDSKIFLYGNLVIGFVFPFFLFLWNERRNRK